MPSQYPFMKQCLFYHMVSETDCSVGSELIHDSRMDVEDIHTKNIFKSVHVKNVFNHFMNF